MVAADSAADSVAAEDSVAAADSVAADSVAVADSRRERRIDRRLLCTFREFSAYPI